MLLPAISAPFRAVFPSLTTRNLQNVSDCFRFDVLGCRFRRCSGRKGCVRRCRHCDGVVTLMCTCVRFGECVYLCVFVRRSEMKVLLASPNPSEQLKDLQTIVKLAAQVRR